MVELNLNSTDIEQGVEDVRGYLWSNSKWSWKGTQPFSGKENITKKVLFLNYFIDNQRNHTWNLNKSNMQEESCMDWSPGRIQDQSG